MTSIPLYQVDSFAERPFEGNPAAVCLLPMPLEDRVMQSIAMEMNLSETAFLLVLSDTESFVTADRFSLRWMTPTCEVNLCGHATMAAAAVLFFKCRNQNETLKFDTLSGELRATREEGGQVSIDLPVNPPVPQEIDMSIQRIVNQVAPGLPIHSVHFSAATKKLLVRIHESSLNVTPQEALRSLNPNQSELMACSDGSLIRGVIVTCKDTEFDFVSRYFAPWNGIPEDPVTGSAHSVLAPYWSKILDNKNPMTARQCSPRGGNMTLILFHEIGRLKIVAKSCVVFEGNLFI